MQIEDKADAVFGKDCKSSLGNLLSMGKVRSIS